MIIEIGTTSLNFVELKESPSLHYNPKQSMVGGCDKNSEQLFPQPSDYYFDHPIGEPEFLADVRRV